LSQLARGSLSAHNRAMDASTPRRLICARCGAAFDCGLGGDCWCAAEPVRLSVPQAGSADDCLCPTCVRAEKAARTGAHS
jgi:Cysteine-rich CWC